MARLGNRVARCETRAIHRVSTEWPMVRDEAGLSPVLGGSAPK